ncbi:MAG: tRNA (guanosine(37)-N1)-methyltransferase TrmD [Chloroflexi bacterium]|nr:tRNA (guanosine(37)-N1)-methyltransferase TrmD [Chloroflexota bacterium]
MEITILTLFPGMFVGPLSESMLGRAIQNGLLTITTRNIRDYATDKHHIVDDTAYGGGPGMLMKPEPIFEAVEAVQRESAQKPRVVLMSPQGRVFNQSMAEELVLVPHLLLICGHYEGVDERVREHLIDDEISVGDYVLTGGELAALVVVDAVARLVPGVVGDPGSVQGDTFSQGLLQQPEYTRPELFRDWRVPPILLSGDHQAIAAWRRRQSILRTLQRRPDLLDTAGLSAQEVADAILKQDDAP